MKWTRSGVTGWRPDEWVVQDWEKGEKELVEAREEEVKYMVEKLNMFEFCPENAMKAVTWGRPRARNGWT